MKRLSRRLISWGVEFIVEFSGYEIWNEREWEK